MSVKMNKITLFEDKSKCCCCSACYNICPQNAIFIKEDEHGYKYPQIDTSKCVKCGLCKRICPYQRKIESYKNKEKQEMQKESYAAQIINEEILNKSASGGIFAAIATEILNNDGIVYGCSLEKKENKLEPKHIRIDNIENLYKIQGSKYVQSDIKDSLKMVKRDLDEGKIVVFSGTPCQIDGLKAFLKSDYEKLLTIDIICHGVPNARIFQDYIEFEGNKIEGNIIEFKFRDKESRLGNSRFL